jgi:hypothetical protein
LVTPVLITEKVAKLAELPCTPGQSSLKDLITKQLSTSMVPLKESNDQNLWMVFGEVA